MKATCERQNTQVAGCSFKIPMSPEQDKVPQYFFDVKSPIVMSDFEGVCLPDLETARQEALLDVAEIRQLNVGYRWHEWSIEVRDTAGAVLLVVPFSVN